MSAVILTAEEGKRSLKKGVHKVWRKWLTLVVNVSNCCHNLIFTPLKVINLLTHCGYRDKRTEDF